MSVMEVELSKVAEVDVPTIGNRQRYNHDQLMEAFKAGKGLLVPIKMAQTMRSYAKRHWPDYKFRTQAAGDQVKVWLVKG